MGLYSSPTLYLPAFVVSLQIEQLVLWVAAVLALIYVLRIIRLARDGIIYAIRGLLSSGIIGAGLAFLVLRETGNQETAAVVAILSGVAAAQLTPARSRYIPKRVRRAAIAKFEATGQKYDSKVHDLDHIVPFARGGGHTVDNLRVVDRRKNRSRGKKMPGIRDVL